MINLQNMDCMKAMLSNAPDNHWDLAIVDPPYGIGMGRGAGITRGEENRFVYSKTMGQHQTQQRIFPRTLSCIQNQIIWGANYFSDMLPPSRGWIYWEKLMGGNYADGGVGIHIF